MDDTKIQIKIETLNSPSMKNFMRGKKNQNPETKTSKTLK
jgi:hypothetical protein